MARVHAKSRPHVSTDSSGTFDGLNRPPWWHQFARCREVDPDLFHPHKGDRTDVAEAICDTCPVKNICLVAGVESGEPHAIYGGLTTYGRAKITPRALDVARRGADREEHELRSFAAA